MNQEQINLLKKHYPVGTRIELTSNFDEVSYLKSGNKGTITGVDDIGNIHVDWDNEMPEPLTYAVNEFVVISEQ